MTKVDKLTMAYQLFDEANSKDPHTEEWNGKTYPKELLYAIRMTNQLHEFAPNASEALRLTARCQHIRRWEIPREAYEFNRAGYLKWRQNLQGFHVEVASKILTEVGYGHEIINQVTFLLGKKLLKKNEDTQTLEDVICLVFLEFYFEPFAQKHPEDKLVGILQKTWLKMSKEGQEFALRLPLSKSSLGLIATALQG